MPTVPVFNVSQVDQLVQAHYRDLPKPITFKSSHITFTGSVMGIAGVCFLFVIYIGCLYVLFVKAY